jgi:hypothetical protein
MSQVDFVRKSGPVRYASAEEGAVSDTPRDGMAEDQDSGSGLPPELFKPRRRPYRLKRHMLVIGWREWLAIPEWGIARIKAKIDTGARTSSVHASGIHYFKQDGVDMVRFKVHPHRRSFRHTVIVESAVVDKRVVRSSNGEEDLRPVVRTYVELCGVCWPLEITLAKRKMMGFRMLLGREAMRGRFVVDPGHSFIAGEPSMPLSNSELKVLENLKAEK